MTAKLGKWAALAILTVLAAASCARADSVDSFTVNGDIGDGIDYSLAPFIVPPSSIPANGSYDAGTVSGFMDGVAVTWSVDIYGPYSGNDGNLLYMTCTGATMFCSTEWTLSLAGTYELSPPSGPPFDQPMDFVPGTYDNGQLVIVDPPVGAPEPGTMLLAALGIIGVLLWKRRVGARTRLADAA
jgi:hypothetical protein